MDILFGDKFNGLTTLSFIAHNPYWTIRDEIPIIFNNVKQVLRQQTSLFLGGGTVIKPTPQQWPELDPEPLGH